MRLPALAVGNPQFTLTIVLLLMLVGVVSYLNMPRSEDPQFDLPITLVEVVYPGASPIDVETLVVDAIEGELEDIENIKKIESQVRTGGARVSIDFAYGTDADNAYNQVKQAVAEVEPDFPAGVVQVEVIKATPTSVAILQLAISSTTNNYKDMEFYAKLLEKEIEALSGVQKASIWGYPEPIVSVDLNLQLLKHHGVSIAQINQILAGRASNITPGFVNAGSRRFNVKVSGQFTDLAQIGDTIVKQTPIAAVRLKDVAEVNYSEREPTYLAYFKGKPVIFLTVEQRAKTNIFHVTEHVNKVIQDFQQTLPDAIGIDRVFTQTDSVEKRVNGFFENLWQGLVLVGALAFIFLGIRESLVVIVVIPLSFIIAIGWLDSSGFGLQQMSIVGLIIALGLLVDNAIVVTESIHREIKHGETLKEAVVKGCGKVGWAIISGTATTMLAFLPMLMLASNTGDFVRSMPVTVVLVLLASLLLALTLTPLLASLLFRQKEGGFKFLQHYLGLFASSIYQRFLTVLIKFRWVILLIGVLTLVALGSIFPQVKVSLFPNAEKPMLLVDVVTPDNSSIEYTEYVLKKVEAELLQSPLVSNVALNVGNSNPRIYYNEIPKRGQEKFGQALVNLNTDDEAKLEALVTQLRLSFSQWFEAQIYVKEFVQGPVTDQVLTVRFISESLDDLTWVSNDLAQFIGQLDGAINLDNPIGEANSEMHLEIDYDKAGLHNMNINMLDQAINTVLAGQTIGHLTADNGEDYAIVVRQNQRNIDALAQLEVANMSGDFIPVNQFATLKLAKGQSNFFHYQKLRMAKVSADVAKGYSVFELTQQIVKYLENYELPAGMSYKMGGEEESRQESFSGLAQIMLVTAIGIFAVLVLQFKSFMQPIIVFSSVPFAITGAALGLYLTNLSFSMMAFIGLISLFGIVVNNAIILIDTTNQLLAAGEEKLKATLKASQTRFTPIILTTLTTVVGLIPLTLLGGGLWQPLGMVIISGLLVSAIASLTLVPVLIFLLSHKKS